MCAVTLGIDSAGDKHVLGLYEGATENTTACKGLLADLEQRGLRTERSMLFVIDGSKALHSAIRVARGRNYSLYTASTRFERRLVA
jgi:transposase-like protein